MRAVAGTTVASSGRGGVTPPLRAFAAVSALAAFASAQEPDKKPAFELKDGDRVVFLGDGFLDRERHYGSIETMLTRRFPGKHLTFRNLAWEGDSVDVQLRPLGFPSLEDLLAQTKPTVIFVSYGMNESFAGEAGLAAFENGYNALLDRITKQGRQIILVSPLCFMPAKGRIALPAEQNNNLSRYGQTVQSIAENRNYRFVNITAPLKNHIQFLQSELDHEDPNSQISVLLRTDIYSDDGIHLNQSGYRSICDDFERDLLRQTLFEIIIDVEKKVIFARGATISKELFSQESISFTSVSDRLPEFSYFIINGLTSGEHILRCGGVGLDEKNETDWAKRDLPNDIFTPENRQIYDIEHCIVEKSRLWFHRWRAHNGEYIWGRRAKAFEGNAGNEQFPAEFAEIDRRIAELEAKIFELAKPVPHTYELVPEK